MTESPASTLPRRERKWLSLNWASFPEQQGCFSDAGIDILVTGIGGGKSIIAAAKMAMWAINYPIGRNGRPTKWCVLGPDYDTVREVQFPLILDHLHQLRKSGPRPEGCKCRFSFEERSVCVLCSIPFDAIVKRVVGGNKPKIELWSGVEIVGFSGTHPKRMRGHAFNGVWIDEAEWQTEQSFAIGLARQRSAKPIRMVVTSSPDGAGDGWLWRVISGEFPEWDEIRRTAGVRVHRWRSRANKALDEGVLATIGAGIEATSPGGARQELDGLFLNTDEAPGSGKIDWRKAFVGRLPIAKPRAVAIGADLGKTQDFCWLTAAAPSGMVTAMDRFNLSTLDVTEDEYWPFVRRRMLIFAHDHAAPGAVLVIDTARGGDHFASALREDIRTLGLNLQVVEVATDSIGKKSAICEALAMAAALGRFSVPSAFDGPEGAASVAHVEALKLEMKKVLVIETGPGRRKWTHPQGGHDDGIVSCGLANSALGVRVRVSKSPLSVPKTPTGLSIPGLDSIRPS